VKRGQKALCIVCENEYAYHGGTSNLRDHLVSAHPLKLRPPEDQRCLNAYLSKAKFPESRAKKITEHIAGMVVRDLRPAAMVEGVGFRALMNYVEPGYHVPSATHIAEVAWKKFTNGKTTIKSYLQFFAFTTDIWTSRANDVNLSLTCHFTTSRWNMVTCVLATAPFPEHHTANNIAEKVQQVMAEYGLEKNACYQRYMISAQIWN